MDLLWTLLLILKGKYSPFQLPLEGYFWLHENMFIHQYDNNG